ncbi:hypothetical protein [uncultured Chryseobacterium sp.]|uniref:hypothetical protein n=1 Tax=uncultured Chryseobacterium sp. TaxID=259322 RepID=UPI0025EB6BF4|nr:hypothetical protein [uncultured Chryseobacterium sp.]
MNILALDIATKTGWACDTASGTWDFKTKRGESAGMVHIRFKARLKEFLSLEKIDIVVYEQPSGRNKAPIIFAAKMIAHLEEYCLENKIQVANYPAKEIKKFWTGNGNAGKPAMIAEAQSRFPDLEIIDDNHADALALLALAQSDLL